MPVNVTVQMPPRAVDLTVKLQPEAMLPPETTHVFVPSNRPAFANVTEVSAGFQPDPDTVTVVPVGPMLGESEITEPLVIVNVADADGVPAASFTVMGYSPAVTRATLNCPATVPSPAWLHVNPPLTGMPVREQEPAFGVKPEPFTDTDTPVDPELGERTILGLTLNVPVAESPPGPVTVTMYPTLYVDPAPTLNFADSSPFAFTLHAGSPDVSTTNPACALIVHA